MSSIRAPLDVYVVFDLQDDVDKDVLEKCISVYINTKQREFQLEKLERVELKAYFREMDLLKNGMKNMSTLFDQLKLKGANETWFIYVSDGQMEESFGSQQLGLILICKGLGTRECIYSLTRQPFRILTTDVRDEKLEALKIFTKSLQRVFVSESKIKFR
jgi:hypothetical protein